MCFSRLNFRQESTGLWIGWNERDPSDEDGIRIYGFGKGEYLEVLYEDIPGSSWNPQRLDMFKNRAQIEMDVRVPLADLPVDDPDKAADPGLAWLFWDGSDLVHRPYLLEFVTYSVEQGLNIATRRLIPW